MDALASPLILTKYRVPTARPHIVPRTHLTERLTPEAGTSLVLVCAPAGYGKTTLLAEWSQLLLQNRVAVAWYALDPSDDDPIPFSAYLVASLAQAVGPTAALAHITQRLRSSPELGLQKILPAIINAIVSSDRDCVMILDDYHLISAPAIHSAISFLLEHLPEKMHIAIGSRSDPPLPLARLRARGKLLEMRAADLRFSPDETARFLNEVMRLDLSPEVVNTLEARTEGWIAGLQLAALSMSGRPDKENFLASFTGSHRYFFEYLFEEVFNRQSEQVQSFLLSTSILERLCGSLCETIQGESSGGEEILRQLEKANLFLVALDEQGYWYRYHHLFRDFLQVRLNKTQPERVAALQRAASEWHAAHGSLREAVQHALQTQDWDYAAAFVEQYGFQMLTNSEFSTIYEWCAAFPDKVLQAHPALRILQSWAQVLGFRRQDRGRIEEWLRQAEQTATALEDRQQGRFLTSQAAVVRTFLAMTPDPAADPRAQLALAQQVLDLFPTGGVGALLTIGYAHMALHDAVAGTRAMEVVRQIAVRERIYFGVAESTFHLARLAHAQGQLRRAAEICRQGRADIAGMLAHPEQELPAVGSLDIALGCILLEQDRLEDAEQALRSGLDLIRWGLNPYYLMTAYLALFRLREIQNRSEEALDTLTRLEEAWPDIAFCTRGLRVVHDLRTTPEDPDMLAKAIQWSQAFSSSLGDNVPLPGMGPFGAAEAYYLARLAWVRVQLAIGKPQGVTSYLARQLDLAEEHGLAIRVIELSLLEAQARQALGDDQHLWAALEHALSTAQHEGFVHIFDQAPALTQLLVEAAQRGVHKEYIERILAAIGTPEALYLGREGSASRSAQTPYGESLSERELQVLRLMAYGATNHEIAEQLVITVGTVKSHINHIFGKLDVHNRIEAVARARGLGLIEI
jgi:LuxR family maltose regulon positive regulatory protein